MTRGQLATVLFRSLDLPAAPHAGFTDVPVRHAHADAIAAADASGLMVGREDGSCAPAERLTRGQMATVLARVERREPRDDGPFPDVGGDVHAPNINTAYAAGLVQGYEDGRYRPATPSAAPRSRWCSTGC